VKASDPRIADRMHRLNRQIAEADVAGNQAILRGEVAEAVEHFVQANELTDLANDLLWSDDEYADEKSCDPLKVTVSGIECTTATTHEYGIQERGFERYLLERELPDGPWRQIASFSCLLSTAERVLSHLPHS